WLVPWRTDPRVKIHGCFTTVIVAAVRSSRYSRGAVARSVPHAQRHTASRSGSTDRIDDDLHRTPPTECSLRNDCSPVYCRAAATVAASTPSISTILRRALAPETRRTRERAT